MQAINKKIKVIFLGSDNFSVPILLELIKNFSVLAVITEIDKPAGRHQEIQSPPTKILAKQHRIPCWQPLTLSKNPKLLDDIIHLAPDVIVTAAYGKIVPASILNAPTHGCINVHPSLLPKYRGASPVESTLLSGDEFGGVSLILMDEGLDTGDIIYQEMTEIQPDDDYSSLSKKLSIQSAVMLTKILPKYVKQAVKLTSQDDSHATYTYKIKKEDGRINWREPSQSISNKIKAFCEWPRAYTFYNGQKIDILSAFPSLDPPPALQAGQVSIFDNKVFVKCGQGSLQITKIKLAGKNETDIIDFLNGHRDFIGSILGT